LIVLEKNYTQNKYIEFYLTSKTRNIITFKLLTTTLRENEPVEILIKSNIAKKTKDSDQKK
jgi:hypothetical protein